MPLRGEVPHKTARSLPQIAGICESGRHERNEYDICRGAAYLNTRLERTPWIRLFIRAGAAVLQAVRLFVDLMVNSDGWTMRLVCGIIYDDRMNEWVDGFK